MDGETFEMDIDLGEELSALKTKIWDNEEIDMKGLNIIYGEYTLEDGHKLGDYDIKNLSTLELQPKAVDLVANFQDIKTGQET